MQKLLLALVVSAAFCVITPAYGQLDIRAHGGNAERILHSCAAVTRMDTQAETLPLESAPNLTYCFGYLLGVYDMHNAINALAAPGGPSKSYISAYCIPPSASASQLAKVVVKYGNDHPEELHQAALVVVSHAFSKAFPCIGASNK